MDQCFFVSDDENDDENDENILNYRRQDDNGILVLTTLRQSLAHDASVRLAK